ncbi:MAG TPA: toll/interleukin-1 receptor domain-containing protein [Propionicimonas sp.]|uniref:toll/interleukin-1 receptor domain-containing protein n=1 Tax=Propionicimonas sp. TaxID=1955623 RepID=UPI002F42C777
MVGGARPRVFLSYRRSDTQHVAGRAADKLADRYELFMDIDTIPPGVDFADYLRRAVGGCDVLVAFIGEGWATVVDGQGRRRIDDPEDWVASEIATALNRGIPVIPVLVDAAVLPNPDTLPDRLRPMVSRQTTPLRFESFSADLNHLVAAIDHAARLSSSGASVPTAPAVEPAFADRWDKEPAPRPRTPAALALPAARRRAPALAIGIGIVALAGAGAWIWQGQHGSAATPVAAAPASSPRASPTAIRTVAPATSVAALKARTPAGFRSTCRKLTPTDPLLTTDLVIAIQCAPTERGTGARPRYAFYFQYPTAAAAETAFRGYYAASAPGAGDCTAEPGEIPDDRSPAGGTGVLRCYRDANGYAVLAWISPEQAIVASAADPDRSLGELLAWWRSGGPTVP